MEDILREILHDDTDLEKQFAHDDFTRFPKKRIIEMRKDANSHRATALITPVAKERVIKLPELEDLGQPSVSIVPKPEVRPSTPVTELQEAYQRKAKNYISQLSKNHKFLMKELERDRPDERRITKFEEKIESAKSDISKIQTAFFGHNLRKGFETPFPEGKVGPVADLLAKVISSRDQLLVTLRKDPQKEKIKNGEIKKGDVRGIHIRSSELGVILDNSGSMNRYIKKLRIEIDQWFPYAVYHEVNGCILSWESSSTALGLMDRVMLAMEDLLIVKKVDALYWFSDLQDVQYLDAVFRLGELFQRSGANFYVSSVDKRPKDELKGLITEFNIQ